MLELFVIFSKGGIALWWFQSAGRLLTAPVNELVKNFILQEKSSSITYNHEKLALKYKLDNEFELVFVVAYQSELALSYIDKFLTSIQLEFRDKYKNDLLSGNFTKSFNFGADFQRVLRAVEDESRIEAQKPRQMRTFQESAKSQKTVASLVMNKKETKPANKSKTGKENKQPEINRVIENGTSGESADEIQTQSSGDDNSGSEEKSVEQKRREFIEKQMGGGGKKTKSSPVKSEQPKKKGKEARLWDLGGKPNDAKSLDMSDPAQVDSTKVNVSSNELKWKGKMAGDLKGLDTDWESEQEPEEQAKDDSSRSGYGLFNIFKSLSVTKTLTKETIAPVLDKMKDHLIAKNVAADIAEKLCDSVSVKLEGKVLGTFSGIASTVRHTLQESCVQILSPKRRIDILRDAMDAKSKGRPFAITFCGVNGVGKSTNLSKVAFWLIENGLSVLIAACDTFRSGAVEQLRTHERKLNMIHSAGDHGGREMVKLFERGYDKDAASVAMSALTYARDTKFDVVLIDTAGRMQDNEPLMRSLAKLIKVNQPDLVLFVGEALVGNEAVDQLLKFNQALADHSQQDNPHLIDGIVLTKFDTIDDKVGAAISMTYSTGQPIVFVGTGQTYTDLKTLNARAVVSALMKN